MCNDDDRARAVSPMDDTLGMSHTTHIQHHISTPYYYNIILLELCDARECRCTYKYYTPTATTGGARKQQITRAGDLWVVHMGDLWVANMMGLLLLRRVH